MAKDSNNENINIIENLPPSATSLNEVEQKTMGEKENSNGLDRFDENESSKKH